MSEQLRNAPSTATPPTFQPEDAVNLYIYLVQAGQIEDNPPMTRAEAESYFGVKK